MTDSMSPDPKRTASIDTASSQRADEVLHLLAAAAREREEARHDPLVDRIFAEHDADQAFGPEFQARVARSLRDARDTPADETPPRVGRPSPGRPNPWPRLALAASLLLACGLVALGIGRLGPSPDEPTDVTLPAYALEAEAVQALRGDGPAETDPVLTVVPGLRFRLVLRPDRRPDGPVDARVLVGGARAVAGARELVPWPAAQRALQVGEHGVIRLEGLSADAWTAVGPGTHDLCVIVAPAGHLPEAAAVARRLDAPGPSASWQAHCRALRVERP